VGNITLLAGNGLSGTTLLGSEEWREHLSGVRLALLGDTGVTEDDIDNVLGGSLGLEGTNGAIKNLSLKERVSGRASVTLGVTASLDDDVVEGVVDNKVVGVNKREELDSEPLSVLLSLDIVEDDEVVGNTGETGVVRGAETNVGNTRGDGHLLGDLGVDLLRETVDVGLDGGGGLGEINGKHDVGPLVEVLLENAESGGNLGSDGKLDLLILHADLDVISLAGSTSGIEASISGGSMNIHDKGETGATEGGLGKGDLALSFEGESNIDRGQIALQAAGLDTTGVHEENAQK